MNQPFLTVKGLKLRYEQKGIGKPILLMHGCPGSIEDWDPIRPQLSQNYQVTAFDRPGHGFSSIGENSCNLDYNAKVALDLIESLQLNDVLVVGHSYGAASALRIAIQNPSHIHAYVLIGSPGYAPVDVGWMNYALGFPILGSLLATTLTPLLGRRFVRIGLSRGFSPNADLVQDSLVNSRTKIWAQTKVAVTRAKELLSLERELETMKKYYKDIQKKVVIVQGDEDTITQAAWKLNEDIPTSKLIVFPDTGHYVQYARPQEIIQIISDAREDNICG